MIFMKVCFYSIIYLSIYWFIYTAQLKFSTDFNMMPHFEWTLHSLFDAINMYGDLKTYILSCPPDKR